VVALGATAAEALLGRDVRILSERGAIEEHPVGVRVLLTVHPSFLLRLRIAGAREREFAAFVLELKRTQLQRAPSQRGKEPVCVAEAPG
jgi:DNA polymerase